MKMEPIVSSETSAIRTQTPGNYPKRNKLHISEILMLSRRNICHNKIEKQEWNIAFCYHFLLTAPQTGKADDKNQQYTEPLLLMFLYCNENHTNGRKTLFRVVENPDSLQRNVFHRCLLFLKNLDWAHYKRLWYLLNSIRKPIVRERTEGVFSGKRNAILIEHAL